MSQAKPATAPQVKRVVIGVGPDKKSAAIHRDSPNHQEVPGIFWRSTLWAATELPVNNQAGRNPGAEFTKSEPSENGLMFPPRASPPDTNEGQNHSGISQTPKKKWRRRARD